jgi:hypothetical protein
VLIPPHARHFNLLHCMADADHAGQWLPAYANHSYARVRNLMTGVVVSNISTTSTSPLLT